MHSHERLIVTIMSLVSSPLLPLYVVLAVRLTLVMFLHCGYQEHLLLVQDDSNVIHILCRN